MDSARRRWSSAAAAAACGGCDGGAVSKRSRYRAPKIVPLNPTSLMRRWPSRFCGDEVLETKSGKAAVPAVGLHPDRARPERSGRGKSHRSLTQCRAAFQNCGKRWRVGKRPLGLCSAQPEHGDGGQRDGGNSQHIGDRFGQLGQGEHERLHVCFYFVLIIFILCKEQSWNMMGNESCSENAIG